MTPVAATPDLEFRQEVLGSAADLTACYQCGTCSVVCGLSTAEAPFPRRLMIWAQWGLKERALASPAVWLCHQCRACSAYCPRDADPAAVMSGLREASVRHYAAPAFMGRAVTDPRYLPLLFGAPLAVFILVLAWFGKLAALPEGPVVFSKLIPVAHVEVIFMAAMILSGLGALTGALRYWRAMSRYAPGNGAGATAGLAPTLHAILLHRRFAECEARAAGTRRTHSVHVHPSHLAVFYGFLGLVATTTAVGIGIYAFGYLTPWPLWHPVKILGNVSGLAVAGGAVVFVWRRLMDRAHVASRYRDWLFLCVLLGTVVTGFLSQVLRLADLPRAAYPTYVVHLVFVFVLLVYLPYSKFAHLVYRTVAMVHTARAEVQATTRAASGANGKAPA